MNGSFSYRGISLTSAENAEYTIIILMLDNLTTPWTDILKISSKNGIRRRIMEMLVLYRSKVLARQPKPMGMHMTNTTTLLITTILWWFEKKNYVCVPSYFDQKLSLDKYTRPIHFLYSDCRQKYWNNIYTVFQVAKNILAFDLMLKIIDFVKTAKTKLPQFIENNKNT